MWLPLTASHAMQQCEKSTYFATSLTADHSNVWHGAVRPRPTPPLWYATFDVSHVPATPMLVICPAITQHRTHCTPLPPASSSCCSIKLCRPTWCVSDLWRPIAALWGKVSFSRELSWHHLPYGKIHGTYADLLWPAYKSTPNLRGKTVPNFLTCMRVRTILTFFEGAT